MMKFYRSFHESAKLAYSRYNVDIEAKRHLHKKEEETKKRRVAKLHKKKGDEERNTLISLTQQVSLFSKTFYINFFKKLLFSYVSIRMRDFG